MMTTSGAFVLGMVAGMLLGVGLVCVLLIATGAPKGRKKGTE